MKKILFILFLITALSCNSDNNTLIVSKLPETINLTGEVIEVPVPMLMPARIFYVDDKLVIVDMVGDSIFKVFQSDGKYLYSWGKKGHGPGEFIQIVDNSINVNKNLLEVLDYTQFVNIRIDRDSAEVIDKMTIPFSLEEINRVRKMNDSVYILESPYSSSNKYEYSIFNKNKGNSSGQFGKFPNSKTRFNTPLDRNMAFTKENTANYNGDEFAAFYTFFNRFKIYKYDGTLIKDIRIKDNESTYKYDPENRDKNRVFFYSPVCNEDFLYVLYQDKLQSEVESNLTELTPKLQIWDWQGNLKSMYQLDKPVTSICISPDGKMVYGVCISEMDKIYRYKIPLQAIATTKQAEFIHLENKLFTIEMFKDWKTVIPSPAGSGEEKNLYRRKDGLDNYFYAYSNRLTEKENANISVKIISDPLNGNITARDYFSGYEEPKVRDNINYKFEPYFINGMEILHTTSIFEANDPVIGKHLLKCAWWAFDYNGTVVEINFAAQDKFEEYIDDVFNIVSSIKMKSMD